MILIQACGPETGERASADAVGPALVPIDSILLPEADTLYIGNPYGLVVDPFDGSFYISDIFSGRLLRFRRDGRLMLVYGRPGEGPGEFRGGPRVPMVLDDSTVAAQTTQSRRVNVFDRNTGKTSRVVNFPALAGITPPVVIGQQVWGTDFEIRRGTSLTRWHPSTGEFSSMGGLPEEYVASLSSDNWSYASLFRIGSLAYADGRFVQGWSGLDEMFVLNLRGEVVDTANIPVARRNGVPADLRERIDIERIPFRERLEGSSRLRQLFPRPGGGFVFTHHDQTALKMEPMPVLTAKMWVGILSADLEKACVDAPVPRDFEIRPMETFRGDTLFVLDRRIDDSEKLQTWILIYLVSDRGCDWLSTQPDA
ncbi:MAG: hypothetical protein OXE96_07325 [Gemmatimonadetes bacterium]|nr:hypothetical protein [Gemmatimonadota bacterium]